MISVPVRNRSNPHQVLFVVNVFPNDGEFAHETCIDEFRTIAGQYIESCLQQECLRAANRMSYVVNAQGTSSFRSTSMLLAETIGRMTDNEFSAVFIETPPDASDLEMLGFLGDHKQLIPYYEPFEEKARLVWKKNRELLVTPNWAPDSDAQEVSAAIVPLRDAFGFARGAILAFDPRGVRRFTYEDIAVMESLGSAFVTRLQVLLAERRKEATMARLTHEMRVPITAFRAAIEQIRDEISIHNSQFENDSEEEQFGFQFEHAYLDDLDIYAETMLRNVREMRLIQQDIKLTKLRFEKTFFEKSIIRPAVRFAQPQIDDRGFRTGNIFIYDVASVLPPLLVDKGVMTQVVSNLIENGIKFAKEAPAEFRIQIEARESDDKAYYEILFKDWGVGVTEGFEKRIFQEGTRGPGAWIHDVLGDGLGLFVARQFAQLHGGDVVFRRNPKWTEFVLRLPKTLDASRQA